MHMHMYDEIDKAHALAGRSRMCNLLDGSESWSTCNYHCSINYFCKTFF